jgi:hypothetical protein
MELGAVVTLAINVIVIICGGLVGYFMKQLHDLRDRVEKTMPEPSIRLLIEDKLEPLEKDYSELSQKIVRIEEKLDLILQKVYEK